MVVYSATRFFVVNRNGYFFWTMESQISPFYAPLFMRRIPYKLNSRFTNKLGRFCNQTATDKFIVWLQHERTGEMSP